MSEHPPSDSKSDKIIAAATELFLEVGYTATSMDAVAKRAQASKTTLYSRFPSKEQLFAACVTAVCDAHGARFVPEGFDGMDLVTALEMIGERFLRLVWSPLAMRGLQVVTSEVSRQPDLARIYYDSGPARTIAMITAFFEHANALGLLSVKDSGFTARQFLASLLGHVDCELRLGLREPPGDEELSRHVRAVVALFLTGVRRT